ncbi:MAG TPA: EFR1 family ferrodoxin, partial [Anaerovoracaceae bacterium]|nr:EFR1 family ferrodoxin [Anaerovoracaceae bacterium]
MDSTIYYFSATGNSLTAARQIGERLGNCELISMASQPPQEPVGGPGTAIGFVFPVFYIGLPRIVRRFVEQLTIIDGTYCFAFVTYGGSRGDTLGMLDDILKEKGIQLSYADGTVMPGNYILKYQAYAPAVIEKLL